MAECFPRAGPPSNTEMQGSLPSGILYLLLKLTQVQLRRVVLKIERDEKVLRAKARPFEKQRKEESR